MIELPDHPWFVGCQFHPELQSRPTRPHPLFAGFIAAAAAAQAPAGRRAARRPPLVERRAASDGPLASGATRCSSSPVPACSRTTRSTCASPSISRASPSTCPAASSSRRASTRPIGRTPARFADPGLEEGLAALDRVRAATGLPVLTDVHLPEQCAPAAQVVDVLQIPAFLCRQTDLLVAAGATGKPVNVKKGQWMHPGGDARRRRQGARRVRASGAKRRRSRSRSTERGTFFGYGDLVVDFRALPRMRAACDAPVDLRRDAQRAAAWPRRGRRERRRARVHPAAHARRVRRRRRRPLPRDASRSRPRAERRAEHDAAATQLDDLVHARGRHLAPRARMIDRALARSHPPRRARRRRRADRRRHLPRRRRRQAGGVQALRDPGRTRRPLHAEAPGCASSSSPGACPTACACARSSSTSRTSRRTRSAQKLPAFLAMLDRHGIAPSEAAFVGDDFPDLAVLRLVGLPVAVGNAVPGDARRVHAAAHARAAARAPCASSPSCCSRRAASGKT